MIPDLGLGLIGFEITFISLLSIPISVLGAIILSWMAHLPAMIRQEIEKTLGSGFVVFVVVGMLGGFLWIVMMFYLICSKTRPESGNVAVGMASFSVTLWVPSAAATPWHPEFKLSSDVLSAPTVLAGCRRILAWKCLIVTILSLLALFILTCIGEHKGIFGPSSNPPLKHTTTTPSNMTEDGAAERPTLPEPVAVKVDLEAGTSEPLLSQPESTQTQERSKAEVVNMAAMDGAS